MNLSTLEIRLKRKLPGDCHNIVERELDRFETERVAMSDDEDKLGQARLTDQEIARLPMGNQHTNWNVVRWQCVKAAALEYGVLDWTSKVDTSLTYEENIALMENRATQNGGPTMRQMIYE